MKEIIKKIDAEYRAKRNELKEMQRQNPKFYRTNQFKVLKAELKQIEKSKMNILSVICK